MAYVSTIDFGQNYITVDISGLSQAQNKYGGFRVRINNGPWQSISVQSGYTGYDSGNYTFYNLSAGTTYYIEGQAYTNAWYDVDAKWVTTSSPPKTATPTNFKMTATKSTEIYFEWSSVSGATKYEVAIYSPFSMSREVATSYLSWGNLSPSTTYYGYVRAYSSSGGWSDWSSWTYVTTPQGKPVDFVWDSSKTSGFNFNISAAEWQKLQQKINEFRLYKELIAYNFSVPSKGNIFYATHYNEVRNAIFGMNPTTTIPMYRNSKEIIYASEINRLRDSLNSIT
ncbi:hypothetical protein ACFYKT_16745 [Cytobacillus sp. FJAT-53684]|uniref:Fibronectin type-III domain-containing protein n=1 Tax=Cytobacillus mangrovibacter TaxID=3299024 RepID=A0ABW6K1G4_9BACI